MKTAEKYLNEYNEHYIKNGIVFNLSSVMKSYAREAIKADRENVAKHAKCKFFLDDNEVNKNSILNAPQIELL